MTFEIVYASFIMAGTLFTSLIAYYSLFIKEIKSILQTKEDRFIEESMSIYISRLESVKDIEGFKSVLKESGKTQMTKNKELQIINEPISWSKNLIKAIFLAIISFLIAGITGFSLYDRYTSYIFMIGVISFGYGVYEVSRITRRITEY